MEKLVKNKAVILFYGVMILMTYFMIGRLEQMNKVEENKQNIVYMAK